MAKRKRSKKKTYLYMVVTLDKYELPVMVEDSVEKLAKRLGIKPNTIYTQMSAVRTGKYKRTRYVRVAI